MLLGEKLYSITWNIKHIFSERVYVDLLYYSAWHYKGQHVLARLIHHLYWCEKRNLYTSYTGNYSPANILQLVRWQWSCPCLLPLCLLVQGFHSHLDKNHESFLFRVCLGLNCMPMLIEVCSVGPLSLEDTNILFFGFLTRGFYV
jgi:hypothetical protein